MHNERVINLYTVHKKSIKEISLIDGRSESTIYKVLIDNNVSTRSRSEANKIVPDNVLIKLYNLALSFSQIGRLLEIDPSTISKRFKLLGFDCRSRSVAKSIKYTDEEFNNFFYNEDFMNKLSLIKG